MGKYKISALNVRRTAINQVANGKISKLPKWVDVVGDIPPSEVLVRTQPPRHRSGTPKARRMFLPDQLEYVEDELRRRFYADHPWELARPRILVESKGKDFEKYNWKQIVQPGKQLDGERYVFPFLPCDLKWILWKLKVLQ